MHDQNEIVLYHYGVKGMRWGVRHTRERLSSIDKAKKKISIAENERDDALRKANENRRKIITPAQKKLDKKAEKAEKRYRQVYRRETSKAISKSNIRADIMKKVVNDPEIKRIDELMAKATSDFRLATLDEARMKREGEIWANEIVSTFGEMKVQK